MVSYIPGGGEVTTDTSGNVFVVGASYGGPTYPYVNPGNGALWILILLSEELVGNIVKFDQASNLSWSTTYYCKNNYLVSFYNIYSNCKLP